MTSLLECSYIRRRLQEMEELYPEPNTLDQCDCTSYSYVGLSLMLLAVGSYISVLALGNIDGYLFSNLGHMWLVGPIFICSGLMIAVKSILYLRRKILIKMIWRQRALLRVCEYFFKFNFFFFCSVYYILFFFRFPNDLNSIK